MKWIFARPWLSALVLLAIGTVALVLFTVFGSQNHWSAYPMLGSAVAVLVGLGRMSDGLEKRMLRGQAMLYRLVATLFGIAAIIVLITV